MNRCRRAQCSGHFLSHFYCPLGSQSPLLSLYTGSLPLSRSQHSIDSLPVLYSAISATQNSLYISVRGSLSFSGNRCLD
jgi:hypothetical protein